MISNTKRRSASLLLAPVDLRNLLLLGARSQGPRPLCLPFSISAAHEAARSTGASGAVEALAVEPLWQHCVNAGAATHGGTTLYAVADATSHHGQTVETMWPYNDSLGAGTEPTPPAAKAGPFNTAELFDVPIAHDGIEENIEDALTAGLPVVVVLEVTAEFESPNTDGEVAIPPLTAPINDYHAVTAVGAATDLGGSARRLLIRNSWGPGWGAAGYGWLPYDYLVAFAVQAGAVDPTTLAIR